MGKNGCSDGDNQRYVGPKSHWGILLKWPLVRILHPHPPRELKDHVECPAAALTTEGPLPPRRGVAGSRPTPLGRLLAYLIRKDLGPLDPIRPRWGGTRGDIPSRPGTNDPSPPRMGGNANQEQLPDCGYRGIGPHFDVPLSNGLVAVAVGYGAWYHPAEIR